MEIQREGSILHLIVDGEKVANVDLSKILSKLDDNKANYLRFCTKYYDPKAIDGEIDFKQFRWSDISEMLKVEIKEVENTLNTPFQLNDFYSFLKYNNMTTYIMI